MFDYELLIIIILLGSSRGQINNISATFDGCNYILMSSIWGLHMCSRSHMQNKESRAHRALDGEVKVNVLRQTMKWDATDDFEIPLLLACAALS